MLERKLADADVSQEEQNNILKDLEKKETEYMRLRRHKMGVDDFELLTIIGRGAFGEVTIIWVILFDTIQYIVGCSAMSISLLNTSRDRSFLAIHAGL